MNSLIDPHSPERYTNPQQTFTNGYITNDSVRPHKHVEDITQIPMLNAEIRDGDLVVIKGDQPANPFFGKLSNESPIAELELGGLPSVDGEPSLPLQTLQIFKLRKDFSPELKAVVKDGFGYDGEDGFLVAVIGSDNQGQRVEGFTFIDPSIGYGIIGRQSNLAWADPIGRKSDTSRWTPFNDSVSRIQLIFTYAAGDLMLQGASNNSRTKLYTRASQEHKDIVSDQENAKNKTTKVETPRTRKTARALLSSILKSNK